MSYSDDAVAVVDDDVKPGVGGHETVGHDVERFPQGYRHVEIDSAIEKSLVRKLDRRLVTMTFIAYLFAFLDRSNIGNAETAGMSKDLGFDDPHYQVSPALPLAQLVQSDIVS